MQHGMHLSRQTLQNTNPQDIVARPHQRCARVPGHTAPQGVPRTLSGKHTVLSSERGGVPRALYASMLADHVPSGYAAGPGSALALCQPPHHLPDLSCTPALHAYHIAVHARGCGLLAAMLRQLLYL